jgi:hypothetical protein
MTTSRPSPPPLSLPLSLPLSPPSAAELSRLAWKYQTLGDLRRARARGDAVPAREVFKALAAEFPGCLNELDTLPLEDIDARASALTRAAEGGPLADWMAWLFSYHDLMRAALRIKPRVARGPLLDAARADRLAREESARASAPIDADFVRAVAAPPLGRLNAAVFDRLAARYGAPAAAIKRALFPRSRRA